VAFIYNNVGYAVETADGWTVDYPTNLAANPKFVSLALDAADRPRLAIAAGFAQLLTYAEPDDDGWATALVYDSGYQERIEGCDIAVDADGAPHIVFADVHKGTLEYATRDAAEWRVEALDFCGMGLSPHITIEQGDRAQITYVGGQGVWRATFKLPLEGK
jgi:hypothetical protein